MSRASALLGAILSALPPAAGGQNPPATIARGRATECSVRVLGVWVRDSLTSRFQSFSTTAGRYNTFYGGGFNARCEGTDQRLRSDSAEHYGDQQMLVLIGRVHYTETRVQLDADRITYYTGEERLIAERNVRGVTNSGTRFTGPHAEYQRVAPGIRDRSRLTAEQRPDVWISPKDAGAASKDSVHVEADGVISDNDSLVYAKGRVVIERPDLTATSDSAFMDNGREFVRLTGAPKVTGRGERKFTLEGDLVDAYSKQRQVERVKSSGRGKATSEDVTLTADTIDLRITQEKLERAFAWGPRRARAHSPDRDITADSIELVMPGQMLREMRAIRRALAVSGPDTTKFTSTEDDWLRGDTLVAHFDPPATGDSTRKPLIRRIVATGDARSFYQVARDGAARNDKPNISYVLGREITLRFKDRQVDEVIVREKVAGFYLEAPADSTRGGSAKDSSAAKPAGKPPAKRP